MVAIPHRYEEMRVLRNLGLNPPSLLANWTFTGAYTPYSHQRETAEFITDNFVSFVFNETGTGKTASALWAAEYLLQHCKIDRVLIVSKLSTLKRVWTKECFTIAPHRSKEVIHATGKGKGARRALLEKGCVFNIINHDGIKDDGVFDYLMSSGERWMFIIDEGTAFKKESSQMHKSMHKLIAKMNPHRVLMTGTPVPNGPGDALGLVKCMYPSMTISKRMWEDITTLPAGPYKRLPRTGWREIVFEYLRPGIQFLKKDCIDLPPLTNYSIEPALSQEQVNAIAYLKKHKCIKTDVGDIAGVNPAVLASKLLQIAEGCVKSTEGQPIYFDYKERFAAVADIIEEASHKVIVFVPHIFTLQRLYDDLKTVAKVDCAMVYGGVGLAQRNEIFYDFQETDKYKAIIAQPDCMAHGLTLTAADTVVWFAPIDDAEVYAQACDRINRMGQKNPMSVYRIGSATCEWAAYAALDNKQNNQEFLMELYIKEFGGDNSATD